MGQTTKIEWTTATWNPVLGCSRVSEGCRHCYAETIAARFGNGKPTVYTGLTQIVNGHPQWTGQIKETRQLLQPLSWRKPKRIFVNSMSDLFHENVTDEMRDRIFAVMALCPQHTFQVLTKRPERMRDYLLSGKQEPVLDQGSLAIPDIDPYADTGARVRIAWKLQKMLPVAEWEKGNVPWPLPNVWLGVSVENQKAADERLDYLCEIASRGWQTMVSFEPLLSSVDPGAWWLSLGAKTWAIVGGESGPGARPMHPDWARGLRDQCVAAGVPFFFKQWGEWHPGTQKLPRPEDNDRNAWVEPKHCRWVQQDGTAKEVGKGNLSDGDELMIRVGKKAAGRLLDGREWNEFPEVRTA